MTVSASPPPRARHPAGFPTRAKLRFGVLSLGVSVGVVALKFWAWRLTHSQIVLSDALESIINIGTSAFALWSVWLASLPRDENHPYGHGKAESLSVGLEGALILGAGLFIVAVGTAGLLHPRPVGHLDWGAALLTATALLNLATGWWLTRAGRRLKSAALVGDGRHLYLDAVTSIVGVATLGLVALTGWKTLDPLAAIALGAFLVRQGYAMLRRAVGGLLDEADPQLVAALVRTLERHRRPRWIDVHNLRAQSYGADLHVDCHVSLPYYLTLLDAHDEVAALEAAVREEGPGEQAELFIHADPCQPPRQCPFCQVLDCPVRERPFVSLLPWTPRNVVRNERHGPATES